MPVRRHRDPRPGPENRAIFLNHIPSNTTASSSYRCSEICRSRGFPNAAYSRNIEAGLERCSGVASGGRQLELRALVADADRLEDDPPRPLFDAARAGRAPPPPLRE